MTRSNEVRVGTSFIWDRNPEFRPSPSSLFGALKQPKQTASPHGSKARRLDTNTSPSAPETSLINSYMNLLLANTHPPLGQREVPQRVLPLMAISWETWCSHKHNRPPCSEQLLLPLKQTVDRGKVCPNAHTYQPTNIPGVCPPTRCNRRLSEVVGITRVWR